MKTVNLIKPKNQKWTTKWWTNKKPKTTKTKIINLAEGPCDVLKPFEHGYNNIVGTFGIDLTDSQSILIESCGANIGRLLLDNDEAGQLGISKIKNMGYMSDDHRP